MCLLPPTDKPDKPTGPIVIEALLKNSVVISWKPPTDDGGSWITNYVVEKCEAKEGAEWQLVSSAISVTTCRIVNLTENAGYYFRVSAQNTFGISAPLEVSSVVIIKSPFGECNLLYNFYNLHMAKFHFYIKLFHSNKFWKEIAEIRVKHNCLLAYLTLIEFLHI